MTIHTLIIGGGPAGLMAAHTLSAHKIPFLLLEKNERVGKKILITGGKRSNVTNVLTKPAFIDALTLKHKRFAYSAVALFGPEEVLDFFSLRGLPLELQDGFKYFPSTNKAQSVIDVLLQGVSLENIKTKEAVISITHEQDHYLVQTLQTTYKATHVIVATGSKSFPSTGSSGDGLVFAHKLGIPYKPFTPAETSVYTPDVKTHLSDLQGVALENVSLTMKGEKKPLAVGPLLVTHFGLSGPSIFHASEFIHDFITNNNTTLCINLCNKTYIDWETEIASQFQASLTIGSILEAHLPKRWVAVVLTLTMIEKSSKQLSNKQLHALITTLTNFEVNLSKVEDVDKAYVNKGGIDTLALNPKTMEVKTHPGLYFIGETIDLHGPIGGFNITLALSMGKLVGSHIASHYVTNNK